MRKLVFFLMVFSIAVFMYVQPSRDLSMLFLLTNFAVIIIGTIGLSLRENEYYSLIKIFMIFTLFLFGFVPYYEYLAGVTYWGGTRLKIDSMIITNILVIFSLLIYLGTYTLARAFRVDFVNIIRTDSHRFSKISGAGRAGIILVVIISMISCLIVLWYNRFNFSGVLLRSGGDIGRLYLGGPLDLLIRYFVRMLPVATFLLLALLCKRNNESFCRRALFIAFLLLVIFLAPTSVARFLAGAVYLAVIVSQTSWLDGRYRLTYAIFLGLLVIFPVLNIFRNSVTLVTDIDYDIGFIVEGHFDAYQNFARAVELDLVSMGSQLLGAILFFVPRGIWPEKPIGSGAYMADIADLSWSNISFPFLAEGYINFSIIGVFVFAGFLGVLSGYFDKVFWGLKRLKYEHSYFPVYYLMLGLLFFILRGDLMSSFAFTVGAIFAYLFILKSVQLVYFLR